MCVETPGVPPLRAVADRGPTDRIPPEELTYTENGSAGWLSVPADVADRTGMPVVVVCHERYGVVQHTIELADRFSAAGFVAVAPDFYADTVLTGDEERLPDVPDDVVLRHLDAAITRARAQAAGDASPLAVIGICRSGSYGVLASAARSDVTAVVMLYGGAQQREYETGELRSTPYEQLLGASEVPVLGLWGERDHTMSVDDVRRVRNLLEEARRSYDFTVFPGMPHGWLNDTMPGRFRSAEAEAAFEQVVEWLRSRFADREQQPQQVTWTFRSGIDRAYDFTKNERLH